MNPGGPGTVQHLGQMMHRGAGSHDIVNQHQEFAVDAVAAGERVPQVALPPTPVQLLLRRSGPDFSTQARDHL